MATVSAWDLGYISTAQCLTRLEQTCESLRKLPRYRGHLFNWYDTQSLVPLAPLYVSTVDSGNLLGYLMTVTNALSAMVDKMPALDARFQEGLTDTIDWFERDGTAVLAGAGRDAARAFRNDLRRLRAALDVTPADADGSVKWLQKISDEIAVLAARVHDAQDRMPTGTPQLTLRDMVARCRRVDGDGTKTGDRRRIDVSADTRWRRSAGQRRTLSR